MQTTINTTFKEALALYISALQSHVDEYFKTNYPRTFNTELHPKYEFSEGKKWVKVIRKDASSRSVFCFIDPETGDIYKPAGWNAPAKGIRSNIHAVNPPLDAGALYRY